MKEFLLHFVILYHRFILSIRLFFSLLMTVELLLNYFWFMMVFWLLSIVLTDRIACILSMGLFLITLNVLRLFSVLFTNFHGRDYCL